MLLIGMYVSTNLDSLVWQIMGDSTDLPNFPIVQYYSAKSYTENTEFWYIKQNEPVNFSLKISL